FAQQKIKRTAEQSGITSQIDRTTYRSGVQAGNPAPQILNETVLLLEGFDDETLPSGWEVQIDGVDASSEVGDCEDAIFSFNCTSDPFFGGLNSDFSGNFAVIDDDTAGFGEESVKSLLTPVIDLSPYSGDKALSFAWTFTYISANGNDYMNVEAWNGSSWDVLFTFCCEDTNGFEDIDISSYSNNDFRIRF